MKNIACEKLRTVHGLLSFFGDFCFINQCTGTQEKKKNFSAKTFKSLDGIFNIIPGQEREIIYSFVGEPSEHSCTKEVYDILETDAEW